jgi:hypothetical protein
VDTEESLDTDDATVDLDKNKKLNHENDPLSEVGEKEKDPPEYGKIEPKENHVKNEQLNDGTAQKNQVSDNEPSAKSAELKIDDLPDEENLKTQIAELDDYWEEELLATEQPNIGGMKLEFKKQSSDQISKTHQKGQNMEVGKDIVVEHGNDIVAEHGNDIVVEHGNDIVVRHGNDDQSIKEKVDQSMKEKVDHSNEQIRAQNESSENEKKNAPPTVPPETEPDTHTLEEPLDPPSPQGTDRTIERVESTNGSPDGDVNSSFA